MAAETNIAIKFGVSGISQTSAGLKLLTSGVKGLGNSALVAAKIGVAALATSVAALGAASIAGAYALSRGVKASLDYGAQMHKLANTLGVDAGQVAVLSQAFRENGLEATMISAMLPKMQRKIAEGSDAFKRLGISVETLKGRSVVDQFEAIGAAVRGLTSQEDKMLSLMQIFEEAGPQMMQLLNSPDAFSGARETLGAEAEMLKNNAAAMERASTLLGNISVKLRGFFSGVAVGVLDPLLRGLESFNRIDFSAIGERFGKVIGEPFRAALQAFKDGRIGDFLAAEFVFATSKFKDVLLSVFGASGLGATLVDTFVSAATLAGEAFVAAAKPKWLTGTQQLLTGAGAFAIGTTQGAMSGNIGLGVDAVRDYAADVRAGGGLGESKVDPRALARSITTFGKSIAAIPQAAISAVSAESSATQELRAARDSLRSELLSRAPDMLAKFNTSASGDSAAAALANNPLSSASSASAASPKNVASDSLARIGGYIGGVSSPATSAAMRTAKNTDKMLTSLDRISNTLPRFLSVSPAATYSF